MTVDTDNLPLTQELVMEVLAARYRLGEQIWPFSRTARLALAALEDLGLVGYKSGIVERTYNAWLTDEGKTAVLSPTYVPPLAEDASSQCQVVEMTCDYPRPCPHHDATDDASGDTP